jgi:ketosteroid isomerase-like protein
MPEELTNVEIVKRLYDAWQRDGFGVVPELMDPDIEYVNPPYAVEPGTRRGYEGFAIAAQAILTVYPNRRFEPLEFHDAGNRVAVRARVIARGVGSSVEVDTERGYVFDVRDAKVVRFAWFNDPLEALEAVGLAE